MPSISATAHGIASYRPRIEIALRESRTIIFGNTQGNIERINVVLNYARNENIPNVISLGRFSAADCMSHHGETPETYLENYRLLLQWTEEDPLTRIWLGIFGKYDYMPESDITKAILDHTTLDGTRETPIWKYRVENLFFSHFSDSEETPSTLGQGHPPILFFSHSYYMGLNRGERARDSGNGPHHMDPPSYQKRFQIIGERPHWVSTGPNWNQLSSFTNFAIYDPLGRTITLQSLPEP